VLLPCIDSRGAFHRATKRALSKSKDQFLNYQFGTCIDGIYFELIQINKLLFIIHKLVKIVYKKTKKLMKIQILLVRTYELL